MEINNLTPQINQNLYLNQNQSLNKIASAIELNQSSNDASSLSISLNLLSQSNGYSQSISSTNFAIATSQITDKALDAQSKILDNVKEKLLQASTDTSSQEARENILKDIKKQLEGIDNIATNTNYNNQNLLQNSKNDDSISSSLQYQIGLNASSIVEQNGIQSNTKGLDLQGLLNQDPSQFSSTTARNYLENIDNALGKINDFRSEVGSTLNQLQSSNRTLLTQEVSTLNANSIFDTNYAKESANFSKQNILGQLGAFAIAQGNNVNQQSVTRLLS